MADTDDSSATRYRLEQGLLGRWIIVHPVDDHLAWSGSRWMPHCGGVGTVAQISNFATRKAADEAAREQVG